MAKSVQKVKGGAVMNFCGSFYSPKGFQMAGHKFYSKFFQVFCNVVSKYYWEYIFCCFQFLWLNIYNLWRKRKQDVVINQIALNL